MTVLSLINSFKVFREVYLLAGEYPLEGLYMLQHFINNTFGRLEYFCFILLIWLVAVPLCLSCYRLPLTGEQLVCLQLIESTLLIALLFGGAVAFFFAFLLRRPIPVFLASAISLFLLQRLSGLVPVPVKLLISLVEWESNTSTQLLIAQSCVTIVVLIAAIVGGWLCFRRQEQT